MRRAIDVVYELCQVFGAHVEAVVDPVLDYAAGAVDQESIDVSVLYFVAVPLITTSATATVSASRKSLI